MVTVRANGFIPPCIPTRAFKVPAGPDWIHEIKHDGYRLQACRERHGGSGRRHIAGDGRGAPTRPEVPERRKGSGRKRSRVARESERAGLWPGPHGWRRNLALGMQERLSR
jgi:hypothetical protein